VGPATRFGLFSLFVLNREKREKERYLETLRQLKYNRFPDLPKVGEKREPRREECNLHYDDEIKIACIAGRIQREAAGYGVAVGDEEAIVKAAAAWGTILKDPRLIGGLVGMGTGALANKKNRWQGALLGAGAGAAAGYGLSKVPWKNLAGSKEKMNFMFDVAKTPARAFV